MNILFVCMGNICRSPTAEAVFRKYVQDARLESRISVDSAGTGDWHVGKGPDQRSCQAAARRGYNLGTLRARQVAVEDFQRFDLILAMDHDNLERLQTLRPLDSRGELDLFLRRYNLGEDAVPDPYFGGQDGFEQVLDLIEKASAALLNEVKERL
ncbi:protein tyrosine phosphatase [Stutzerimonas stutzeri]|uniref:protein-tyrosine-phosphatase n=1 Tax=Stutzerimonas stutzeri TaxID=316 RepID=W8R8Z4_STUST|nr:low molecular weight protein-tyrosine-phosphatase [Stutzerimonas stutzeri]AHL74832.1 protein tyrosine phosphatase [Stutzerimonas stutzeri]MCQ4329364.1 low molecular weight phosphotyrosine protein phosphatase [Stutzerimonas stutzeri]